MEIILQNYLRIETMDWNGRRETNTFKDCSFVVDNCDHSIRVEKNSDTIAHFDNWINVRQDIVR